MFRRVFNRVRRRLVTPVSSSASQQETPVVYYEEDDADLSECSVDQETGQLDHTANGDPLAIKRMRKHHHHQYHVHHTQPDHSPLCQSQNYHPSQRFLITSRRQNGVDQLFLREERLASRQWQRLREIYDAFEALERNELKMQHRERHLEPLAEDQVETKEEEEDDYSIATSSTRSSECSMHSMSFSDEDEEEEDTPVIRRNRDEGLRSLIRSLLEDNTAPDVLLRRLMHSKSEELPEGFTSDSFRALGDALRRELEFHETQIATTSLAPSPVDSTSELSVSTNTSPTTQSMTASIERRSYEIVGAQLYSEAITCAS